MSSEFDENNCDLRFHSKNGISLPLFDSYKSVVFNLFKTRTIFEPVQNFADSR